MKKIICSVIILTTSILFLFITKMYSEEITNHIESIWEYPGGAFGKMSFILYRDGKFLYTVDPQTRYKGNWEYNKDRTQIIFTFNQDKAYWDKIIFKFRNFQLYTKTSVDLYNEKERKVGFIIKKSKVSSLCYIDFLGFNFFKK